MTVSPQRAEEVLARFRQQKPEAARLAELVCLAARIEHGLLREARLRLAPGMDAGAEADLWFSPLTESWSARAFVLNPAVAALLQGELLKDRERAQRAWALTERLHAQIPPIVAVEERVTWLALSQGTSAQPEIERELQAVLRTMIHDERQGPGVARWALRAIPRLPPVARETSTARLLAFGAAARLGLRMLVDGAAPLPPQDASWLLPQSSSEPLMEIRIVRTEAGLTFFHGLTRAEGHPLLIPNTRPLLLEVAWVQEGQEQHRLIEAKIDATLPIPADVGTIRLRTVAGDEYELSAERSSNAPPLPRYLDNTVWQSLAWIPGRPHPTTAYFIDSSALITAAAAFLDEPAESPVEIVWNEHRIMATLLHTDLRAGYALLELPEGSPRANPPAGTIISTNERAVGDKRDWVAYGLLEGERLWIEGHVDHTSLALEEEVYATRASMPFDRLPIGSPIFIDGLFLVGHVGSWDGQTVNFETAHGVRQILSELREARARRSPAFDNLSPAEASQETSSPIEEAGVSPLATAPVDFYIITTLQQERDAVLSKLEAPRLEDTDNEHEAWIRTTREDDTIYRVIVAGHSVMGASHWRAQLIAALRRWNPRYVLLVGIAGGFGDKVALGDVIVASQVVGSTRARIGSSRAGDPLSRHWELHPDEALLHATVGFVNGWQEHVGYERPEPGQPRRVLGSIGSGERVVSERSSHDLRDYHPKLMGVEMEDATHLLSALKLPPALVIRGVSELVGSTLLRADRFRWNEYACHTAAAYAIGLLRSGPVPGSAVDATKPG